VVLSFADSRDNVPALLLERSFWITISICVLTPICFLRSLHSFRYLSYFALVVVADLLFVVLYKFFDRSGLEPRGHIDLFHVSPALVSSLPIYVFAFTCAQNLFSIHNELIDVGRRNQALFVPELIINRTAQSG
jgi:amino acid permease